jgi:Cys-rich repeat protein
MMKLRTFSVAVALLSPLGLLACGSAPDDALSTARKALECQTSSDCGGGAECAVEDNGSFCKLHEQSTNRTTAADTTSGATGCASDADCAAGLECESHHDFSYCKPGGSDDHGSDDYGSDDYGSAGSSGADAGAGGAGDGSAAPGNCASDADCAAGLECEHERGVSYCKPHGSHDGDESGSAGSSGADASAGGSAGSSALDGSAGASTNPAAFCASDADCANGQECETEHGASHCKAHGGDSSGKGRD